MTSDFDTIWEAQTSVMAALARIEAAAEQTEKALALADEIISPISAASEEVGIKILAFRAALASADRQEGAA